MGRLTKKVGKFKFAQHYKIEKHSTSLRKTQASHNGSLTVQMPGKELTIKELRSIEEWI